MRLNNPNVVLLVGGVGGAKLAYGMAKVLPPERLTIIVNTGDDFWLYGLKICPDIDTIIYTLAEVVNRDNGWGLANDTFATLESLHDLGDDAWFRLGDKDLATHMLRTKLWHEGQSLTDITHTLATRLGIRHSILPMTDTEMPTVIETAEYGEMDFQSYFVRHRWQPRALRIFSKIRQETSVPDAVSEAIDQADAIVIGPSNPWLSINPILSVPSLRDMISGKPVPRIAVTPVIQGQAVKGPTAKIMQELGYAVSPQAVGSFYGSVINGFVIDQRDQHAEMRSSGLEPRIHATDTLMDTEDKRIRLAEHILDWIKELKPV
jgi:LPPG:FO 2-phospho-L-lactate transferase